MTTLREALDAQMSEEAFQEQVIAYAKARGWLVYHTHNSKRSAKGFPDLVLCRPPRLVHLELKDMKRKATREQEIWLSALEMCDATEASLARPSDWKRLELMLR